MPTATTANQTEGIINLLSKDLFPRHPALRGNQPVQELERFIKDLESFLRRQFGRFTAENIITTINNVGGVGFDKVINLTLKYTGTDNPTKIVDNTLDWRERAFLWHGRIADTVSHLQNLVDDPNAKSIFSSGSNLFYPFNVDNFSDPTYGTTLSANVTVNSTGGLQLDITNSSGVHKVGYIHFSVYTLGHVNATPLTNVGNGL